jgi:hypothetical protein
MFIPEKKYVRWKKKVKKKQKEKKKGMIVRYPYFILASKIP